MKKFVFAFMVLLLGNSAFAWDGFDYDKGAFIEIEKGNLVRVGNDIEIFDYSTGTYKDVEVQSVTNGEIDVYDYETGEYRTFDMD